jgi:hypothetical protein
MQPILEFLPTELSRIVPSEVSIEINPAGGLVLSWGDPPRVDMIVDLLAMLGTPPTADSLVSAVQVCLDDIQDAVSERTTTRWPEVDSKYSTRADAYIDDGSLVLGYVGPGGWTWRTQVTLKDLGVG